jgi:tRNA pseudouridine55 synthase
MGTRRVGHAGTLDPMATGVLVVGVEGATKLLDYIVAGRKRYLARLTLGASSSTDDREGEILQIASPEELAALTDGQIGEELAKFLGEIMQVPTKVSAIKVAGKRAHELVRAGTEFELAARPVTIHDLMIYEIIRKENGIEVEFDAVVSAGTYIRAIARDLGQALGVGGHLIALRRLEVDPFEITDARRLDDLAVSDLIPTGVAIAELMPVRIVNPDQMRELSFGRYLSANESDELTAALSPEREFLALLQNVSTAKGIQAAPKLVSAELAKSATAKN